MRKVEYSPFITIMNFVAMIILAGIVAYSLFSNFYIDWVYVLYIVPSVAIFISLFVVKRYFRLMKLDNIVLYLTETQYYNLATSIVMASAYILMKLSFDTACAVSMIIGSLTFSLSFLKTFMFGIRGLKRK